MLFVNTLPEKPVVDAARENTERLEQFAGEFFSLGEELRRSGVGELVKPYWNALLWSRISPDEAYGVPPEGVEALRREADELLGRLPEDVVQALYDIRAAQNDIFQNLRKAAKWARRNKGISRLDAANLEQRIEEAERRAA